MKRFLLTLLIAALPVSATSAPLAEDLRDYVTAFDVGALETEDRKRLRNIIADEALSHGDKVLSIHSVLQGAEALRHVDIHGGPLPRSQTGARQDAGLSVDLLW